ncbi:unnamed protein product [Bursaphelenchus xylophilus]|uniref:Hexosyltransferase n=1 Tax=Bursaphelenchus xylophilus TaxID=6326 RepID=A0A1I7RVL7_BURXY|nr:unnamed protein product [Bursaphelenchus xylophilus]CAG9081861.1 unnamed protein product [Bursaphelenchus xylophilus]
MNALFLKKKFLLGFFFIVLLTVLLLHDHLKNHRTLYNIDYVPQNLTIGEFEKLLEMEKVNLKIGTTEFSYNMSAPQNRSECNGVEMVVYTMTMTDLGSFHRRKAIREVISTTTNRSVLFRFFVGKTDDLDLKLLVPEMMAYGDIVYYDHVDTYRENFVKWYSMHEYHLRNCPNVKYFVKMDDDVTADFGRLFDWIDADFDGLTANQTQYFLCHRMHGFWPIRNKNSRWYIDRAEFSENRWPDYCFGYFLLTTNNAIKSITETMKNVNLVHMDDCFITGIVRRNTTIPLHNWSGICSNPREIDHAKCSKDDRIPWPIALHNTKNRSQVERWLKEIREIKCPKLDPPVKKVS